MEIVLATVESAECRRCTEAVACDCRALGLPTPTGTTVQVRRDWVGYECPHVKNGLILREALPVEPTPGEVSESDSHGLDQWRDQLEADQFPWEPNLDATKDYGYPAREFGRYGSHPSHDDFDDESDS